MRNKIVILIFFTLTIINTIIVGLWILDIGRKTVLLTGRYESAVKLDRSLYDNTFLKAAISKLEEEIVKEKDLSRKDGDSLKMTEDVLLLLEQNRINIISYRLEGGEPHIEASKELLYRKADHGGSNQSPQWILQTRRRNVVDLPPPVTHPSPFFIGWPFYGKTNNNKKQIQ